MQKIDILIRPLRLSDINKNYIDWFSDIEVTKFLEARNISIEESRNYLRSGITNSSYYIYAICDKHTSDHIGNIKIGPIRRLDGVSDLVTVIGDRQYWGKGVASKAIKKIINYSFLNSGLRMFSASIDSNNIGSLNAYLRAGFKLQARLENYFCHYIGDTVTYSDKLYVVINNMKYNHKKLKNWKPISLSDIG